MSFGAASEGDGGFVRLIECIGGAGVAFSKVSLKFKEKKTFYTIKYRGKK